jgi:hypothetical protein
MRMLYWPLRSPTSASKRFPGNAARSRSGVAASIRSSFRHADRSNPENALTRFPAANSLVLLSRKLTITTQKYQAVRVTSSVTYQRNMQLISWIKRAIHDSGTAIKLPSTVPNPSKYRQTGLNGQKRPSIAAFSVFLPPLNRLLVDLF